MTNPSALILLMQKATTLYLTPDTYVRRSPGGTCKCDTEVSMPVAHQSEDGKMTIARQRDAMFIGDIIYFLDSKEHGTNVRK